MNKYCMQNSCILQTNINFCEPKTVPYLTACKSPGRAKKIVLGREIVLH